MGLLTINEENKSSSLKIKVLANTNEKELLEEFNKILNSKTMTNLPLCAHNGKEFDYPYLCRRMLINEIPLPFMLDIRGKKPWEAEHLMDTVNMWKFGDYKHFTSLETLCGAFNIYSSKEGDQEGDIDGSKVTEIYYEKGANGLKRIADYCSRDIEATVQVYLKLHLLPLLETNNIKRV